MKLDPALIQSLASSYIPYGKQPDATALSRQKRRIRDWLTGHGLGQQSADGIIESAITRQARENRSGRVMFIQDCHLRDTLRDSGLLTA